MEEKITELLLMQRIRNRLIEYFEMVANPEELKEYQRKAPVCVLNELVEQWRDWVNLEQGSTIYELFPRPPFTSEEQVAIYDYESAWNKCALNSFKIADDIYEFLNTDDYKSLQKVAKEAYSIFSKRGRLSEEQEIT